MSRAWPVALLAVACGGVGPNVGDDDGTSGPAATFGDTMAMTTLPPLASTSSSDGADGTEDSEGDPFNDTSFCFCTDGGGGISHECDLFLQDCDRGEKCLPYANDGGPAWNATRCAPVDPDAASVGEACQVEGSAVSGFDDCAAGHMCLYVDPDAGTGTCVELCGGTIGAPLCSSPTQTCTQLNDAALSVCVERCDPLLQDCAEGLGCVDVGASFACLPAGPAERDFGVPCEYVNGCAPGYLCAPANAFTECLSGVGCCTTPCDLADSHADLRCSLLDEALVCAPWGRDPIAGDESVGACVRRGASPMLVLTWATAFPTRAVPPVVDLPP